MAENGYAAPVAGHVGRIPNYGKTQVNPMGCIEPPACIQNAMMTKDKKPFTYTPGGLDLSQIRTPSMARRMARQRSLEEQEQAYAQGPGGGCPQPGSVPPPPPPPQAPAPPPPPPLIIEAPKAKSPNPVAFGERPEIVIPENPIGMLRKTNSPYHWEVEKAELQKMGPVPKFQDKVPSPLTVKMPPSTFSQQPPQNYTPPGQNFQRQNYPPYQNNQAPESPIYRPEAQYANQKSPSPHVNANGSPVTREILQRQDSQFNKSPQPFNGQSPIGNGSLYSPTPNNNWRQPERKDSPAQNVSQQSPQLNHNQYSPKGQQNPANYQPPAYHTLPRAGPRTQDIYPNNTQNNNTVYNNTSSQNDPAPWRTNTLNRQPRDPDNLQLIYHNSQNVNQQPTYTQPWKQNVSNNNQHETYNPSWNQENKSVGNQPPPKQQHQYNAPWATQDVNNNRAQDNNSPPWRAQANDNRQRPVSPRPSQQQDQQRYQSTISIPVQSRNQNPQPEHKNNNSPQKEVVYVNQEPVYFCPDSPKAIPPWVKTQKEKTKTPPPAWIQRPLEGRKSAPRELVTPPRETDQEPEWVRKSNEMQRGMREVISPPKYTQPVQPTWSTRPSDNRKSLPRDNAASQPTSQGPRILPVQMDMSGAMPRDEGNQPNMRIVINMQGPGQGQQQVQGQYSQPTQRIMRVLSPQLVRLDEPTQDLPSLNRNLQNNQDQPKTRIIPIQIEGGNGGANKRVYYHKFSQEGPPRQSKAFRVLQIITNTQDDVDDLEDQHGYSDL